MSVGRRQRRDFLGIERRAFFAGYSKGHRFSFTDPLAPVRNIPFVSSHAVLDFKFCRRCADVNDLVGNLHELVEIERPIIEGAGQAEPVIYKDALARAVAFVHSADLRDGGVRFIDDDQKIFREKVDNRVRLGARRASGQMA